MTDAPLDGMPAPVEPPPAQVRAVDRFKLGDPVAFTHTLDRVGKFVDGRRHRGYVKEWVPESAVVATGEVVASGVVVGYRTLSDGRIVDEEFMTYEADRSFPAYLIAYDLRRRPVLVLPEHVEEDPSAAAQLAEVDRNARAYGWEIGRGRSLVERLDAVDPENPFLDADWRDRVEEVPS